MKITLTSLLCGTLLLCSSLNAGAQASFGQPQKVNDGWRFTLDAQDTETARQMNAGRWQTVNLPHDWSVRGQLSPTLASCTGFLPGGIGWYTKQLDIPAAREGEKVYIYFEGVYNRSEVYLNGQLLGERPNGYVSFMYDLTPYVNYGGENTISVKVDHSQSADSRWYTGSGIYRNVWLIYANPVHIAQWGVYSYPSQATAKQGVLNVSTEVENGSGSDTEVTVVTELLDPAGNSVARANMRLSLAAGGTNRVVNDLKVKNPQLWSIDTANLYTLKTTVQQNGTTIDETETRTGFRTFTFDPNRGFALNGEWMKMKGVCIHHDAGVLGSAVPKEVWRRRLLTLKSIGCNAIRTSHNPQSPDLYDLADELGMLVMDEAYDEWEFPKRKWLEGWNVGTPGFQGPYDFFGEWGERDLADIVRRDRNHMSVFAWSIGNEVDYPNDPYSHPVLGGEKAGGFTQATYGGYNPDAPDANRLGDIAKRLVAVVKEYDRSRPTTAGLAGVAMSNETEYPGALDIAGYNYTESRYITDHEAYPDRVIYGSENRHEKKEWDAVTENDHIFGQFLWTGIDYLGESGRWPSRGFYSGLLDFGGFVKPRGYFRKSLWTDEPMAYIGTYPTPGRGSRSAMQDVWSQLDADNEGGDYVERTPSMDAWPVWNYREGQSIRVVTYTNAAQARLLLNGTEAGETKPYDQRTGIIYWDIPYSAGKLEVVGMDASGNETVRHAIQSSGRPERIVVESATGADGLWQVVLQVVDGQGVPVMLSDDEITCHIRGEAKLLGLEASNNSDMGDYTDNRQRTFHGKLLAYIQADGDARVMFSAPWLEPAECTVNK